MEKNKTDVKMALVFLNELPVNNAVVDYAFESSNSYYNLTTSNFGDDFTLSVIVDKNCILGIQTSVDGESNVFPEDIYTIYKDNINYPRVFTEDNYDWNVDNKYYSSSKIWSASMPITDNKLNGVFYNLYKDETVHIEAQREKSCGYAIFGQSNYPSGSWTAERKNVAAGGTVDIPITEDFKKIWIFRQEGPSNMFLSVLRVVKTIVTP